MKTRAIGGGTFIQTEEWESTRKSGKSPVCFRTERSICLELHARKEKLKKVVARDEAAEGRLVLGSHAENMGVIGWQFKC